VPNFLHLVISYADKSLSIAEAACLKSFILEQNPDTFYIHLIGVDLSVLGDNWKTLYNDINLQLEKNMRVVNGRHPSELNILGQASVKETTAKIYWKFFVLQKYGGILIDRNILLKSNLDHLR